MKDLQKAGVYPPAKGLRRLTWAQVEMIDEIVDLMCELTEEEDGDIEVVISVKNGKPRRIKRPLVSSELKPII